MGDGAHFSPTDNDSGNPAVWRKLTWTDDYGDDNTVWGAGSYVEIFDDGHVETYVSHLANNRSGDMGSHPDVSFVLEIWFMKGADRFGGPNYFVVFKGMTHDGHKENITVPFPPTPGISSNYPQADAFVVYRHANSDPIDPGWTVPIPVPDDDDS